MKGKSWKQLQHTTGVSYTGNINLTPWYKFKLEDPEVMSFKTGLTVLFFHGVFLFWVLLITFYYAR